MKNVNPAIAPATQTQGGAAISLSELSNKRIETGVVRSHKGCILLIWFTDIQTEEAQSIPWSDLSPRLQEAVWWLASDPLKLLDRYAIAIPSEHTNRPPAAIGRAA